MATYSARTHLSFRSACYEEAGIGEKESMMQTIGLNKLEPVLERLEHTLAAVTIRQRGLAWEIGCQLNLKNNGVYGILF
jgi:hypothetical protein